MGGTIAIILVFSTVTWIAVEIAIRRKKNRER